jgi:diacylglycerol kinase (ATP)
VKIAVILNGISLFKSTFYQTIYPVLKERFAPEIFETRSKRDGVGLAAKAVVNRFDLVFAAGGDGTIHQVVNGLLSEDLPSLKLPVLGVIPLGSGNDFVRSIPQHKKPWDIVRAIETFNTREIDIGEVHYSVSHPADAVSATARRFFINVADVGMGPEVVRKVTNSGRVFGSAMAYYQGIISTFFSYKPVMLCAEAEGWRWKSAMRTFAIANGKYYGNGLCIAPDAALDDGKLDVFACGGVSVLDFIMQSIPLRRGRRIENPEIKYHRAKMIKLWSESPLEIEADGEILGWLPATVGLAGVKLRVLTAG